MFSSLNNLAKKTSYIIYISYITHSLEVENIHIFMNENIHPKTTSSILKIDKVTHRYSVNEFFIRSLYRMTSYLVKSMTNPLQ